MAFTFSLNNAHSSQQALYQIKVLLVAAGWVVKGSGDGTGGSFSATGDIITGFSTVTDGVVGAITNRRAWMRLQAPDGRELLIQHSAFNTATDLISCAYSRSATFVGTGDGAIGASVAPTATDAWLCMGERRPSLSMTGTSLANGNTVTRVDYIIGGAAEGYSFAVYVRRADGAVIGGLFYEKLVNANPADTDPYMVWSPGCYTTPFSTATSVLWDQRQFWTYGDAGVGAAAQITQANGGPLGRPAHSAPRTDAAQKHCILRPGYWGGAIVHNPGGANPFNANVDIVEPAIYYATNLASSNGPPFGNAPGIGLAKGESRFIKGISSAAGFNNLDTNTALTRLGQIGGFWLLWDGATTPLA